jgi:predicted restriction endonuclease
VPPNWINDPKQRAKTEQEEYARELGDLEGEPGAKDLTPTEKLALVKARRGQGKFREDLVEYWAYCAVTACGHLGLLRASHIRPWHRCDNNQDRLNPFNGLLLSPTLDLAFDRGLITFEDTGRIKISKQLSGDDKKALGIHPGLRLCKVSKEHFPYLEYHRQKVFKVK